MDKNKIDLILLILFPIFASVLSFMFKANAFESIILFLVLPSLYLSIRVPQHIKKSLIFSVILGVPTIIWTDYIAHLNRQWLIPESIFPFRLFSYVTIEVIIWAIAMMYLPTMFYEYFLDKKTSKGLSFLRSSIFVVLILIAFSAFAVLFFWFPDLLRIPYFYLFFGLIIVLLPILIEFFRRPNIFSRLCRAGSYFFFLTFLYEITGLKLGWWDFPGPQLIGWVSILGVRFPFEELFFWIMLFAMAWLSYYEFFLDDEK